MCGFILSFWRIRRLIYSCRVSSKAQLVRPSWVAPRAAIDAVGDALAASSRRFPPPRKPAGPALRSERSAPALRPPESPRGICYISERHRQGVIIYSCAPKYTVTFVPRALVTISRKRWGQEMLYPSVLCSLRALPRRCAVSWEGAQAPQNIDRSGDHTVRNELGDKVVQLMQKQVLDNIKANVDTSYSLHFQL